MFETKLLYVLGPIIICITIVSIFLKMKAKKIEKPVEQLAFKVKWQVIMFGIYIITLWFMLPSTPSFSTFGYPDSVTEINSQQKILEILQEYNKTIARTTDVVYWFIFIFIFGFLNIFNQITKFLKDEQKNN